MIIITSYNKIIKNLNFYNYSIQGIINYSNNNHQKALFYYQKAHKLRNNDFKILYNAGLANYQLSKYADAKILFVNAININPYFYEGYLMLAKTNIQLNDDKEALQILNKLNQINSSISESFYLSGILYLKLGQLEKSKIFFNQVLKLSKENTELFKKSTVILHKFQ
ncbi:MAG TPA: tetratricopeptide repeat protein [bacterium]|nr:tetratricopeptide repeat protein [bacterium]